ncbi:MAG: right-handed parallel beta-helix repeat-containing protein [Armatimonadota bacterium]
MRLPTPFYAMLLVLALCLPASSNVIYVRATCPGTVHDGRNWDTAIRKVQDGIKAATAGDEVWVAAGTYTENIALKDGVLLYGGFPKSGGSWDLRIPSANPTILDGGAVGNVVTAQNATTYGVRIDGFIIRNAGTSCSGISCSDSRATVSNNRVCGNAKDGINCNLTLATQIVVSGNLVTGNGGNGIYCSISSGSQNNSSAYITNNTVTGNNIAGIAAYYAVLCNNIIAFNPVGITGWGSLRSNCVYNPDGVDYAGLSPGQDDIRSDPRLVSVAFGETHLRSDSPCIDAGYNYGYGVPHSDFDAHLRPQNGIVDIGAYEYSGTDIGYVPSVIRVASSGRDDAGHDGSSWELAKRTVQAGIDAASIRGGEVWVAAATYAGTVNLKSFVYVYGGFSGTEISRDQRNLMTRATTLDGAASGVVVEASGCGYRVAGIDGFTICNGSGTNTTTAAGIRCDSSSPIIANNVITGNFGNEKGGGIGCYDSSAAILNNTVIRNRALSGGGIYCQGGSPLIANNVITENCASGGGGITCSSAAILSNNTVTANVGGGIACFSSDAIVTNNIVAFNSWGLQSLFGATPKLSKNCVHNPDGYNYAGLAAGPTDIGDDPKLVAAMFGRWHLLPDSPCIDSGDDGMMHADWLDLDLLPRKSGRRVDIGADEFDGTLLDYSPTVVRVSTSGKDQVPNDGSTWALAKRTIQAGIDAAAAQGGEVWVASGIYTEKLSLKPYTYVYGGFGGTENTRADRNFTRNATVINGNSGGSVVSALNIGFQLSGVDGFTIRNGNATSGGGVFCRSASPTLQNDRIIDNVATNVGGGIYCDKFSEPNIRRCSLTHNANSAVYCHYSRPRIVQCLISGNSTLQYGGGAYFDYYSEPLLENNLIFDNTASKRGGGIYTYLSPARILNNTVAGNSGYRGGGIYCDSSSATIIGNVVAFNSSGMYKSDAAWIYTKPTLQCNLFFNPDKVNYSGISPDSTNISLDPLFANRAAGDYHILPGSPCIDAADSTNASITDLDGNPRPKDGNSDGIAKFDIGCYEAPANYNTIASAKALADGSPVGITCPISTAILPDMFYVETSNRITGIGVLGGISSVGKQVTIEGTMATVNGERLIQPSLITENSTALIPAPWFVNCNSLGGGPCGLQSGVSDWRMIKKTNDQGQTYWERDLFTYGGASNVGLLVKMTGRVTNSGQGFFYLDGSTAFDDGVESIKGIRVDWLFAAPPPADGVFIEILGISSCRIVHDTEHGDIVVRLLRPIAPDSCRILSTPGD